MPGYRKAFKDIKALVQEVSTEKGVSAGCWRRVGRSTSC